MKTIQRRTKMLGQDEFFKLFEKFIFESEKGYRKKKNGERIRSQSVDNYRYTLKLLEKFSAETSFEFKLFLANKLTSTELAKAKKYWSGFYLKFTEYLYKQGHYDNYVGFSIKNLRSFFEYINNELLINTGPFHKQFHVPKEDIDIVVLSPTQLNYLIYDKRLNEKLPLHLQTTKDLFVLGCTVALRFSDLMGLKPYNLVKQADGHYLRVRSKKTGTETIIKLPEYAVDIILKYRDEKEYLLPTCSNGYFNLQLKKLGAYINNSEPIIKVRMRKGKPIVVYKDAKKKTHYTMADHITSHTMRRTAITTMLRLGMPETLVRKISGHAANSVEFYKYVSHSQTYINTETEKVFAKLSQFSYL